MYNISIKCLSMESVPYSKLGSRTGTLCWNFFKLSNPKPYSGRIVFSGTTIAGLEIRKNMLAACLV